MTRLESRPTGEAMGSYCFTIDFEGHVADERVGETLMGLRRVCAQVRFLGSYPRADDGATDAAAAGDGGGRLRRGPGSGSPCCALVLASRGELYENVTCST